MSKTFSLAQRRLSGRLREIVFFVLIGLMNTAIDFAVLNLLVITTHQEHGWWLLLFNGLGFLAAVINSYILNGRVTFRAYTSSDPWRFVRFVLVNAVGLAINSGIVLFIAPLLEGRFPVLIAINVSKLLAIVGSLTWNYIALRRWVFHTQAI